MANPNSVNILEETRVAPSSNSPKSAKEFSLELTFFDICWFKFPPVECVYFYELSESDSIPSTFNSEILPRLKQSLSLALVHYLPLAGNLTWPSDSPKPIILYTPNDSVSLTIAESSVKNFDILSGNDMYQANLLHPLVPELKMIADDIAAILSLQITLFPHQGFSIGMTASHGLVDGKVATMFFKSWAYLFRHGDEAANMSLPPELTPDYDRSSIKDPTRLDFLYLNDWMTVTASDSPNERNLKPWQRISVRSVPDEMVRATFGFSKQDVQKLREKVLLKENSDGTKPQPHLSTFVVSLAHTITCMIRAKEADPDRPIYIVLAADCRARLDPPLPLTYFGNCVISFKSYSRATNFMDEENGFAFAIQMLNDLVEVLRKDILDGAEEKVRAFFAPKEPGFQLISVAGSPQLKFYESDFGLGKLKKVEIVSVDRTGAVAMTESRDGSGGIEVSLTLKKHEMEHFTSLFSQGFTSNV
ncbi:Transferase [Corchorus olitorius]|uniref:Transferase n=1 Tax=Corchorus olitorius TaxID=93759 RepID=A0A1R3JAU1_9ROSI|nr:Transferase [Corchorus olitorius]